MDEARIKEAFTSGSDIHLSGAHDRMSIYAFIETVTALVSPLEAEIGRLQNNGSLWHSAKEQVIKNAATIGQLREENERLTAELADVKEMFSAAESEESRLREKCGVLTFELSEARKEILQLTNELGGLYVHRDMLLAQSEKPAPAVEEVCEWVGRGCPEYPLAHKTSCGFETMGNPDGNCPYCGKRIVVQSDTKRITNDKEGTC